MVGAQNDSARRLRVLVRIHDTEEAVLPDAEHIAVGEGHTTMLDMLPNLSRNCLPRITKSTSEPLNCTLVNQRARFSDTRRETSFVDEMRQRMQLARFRERYLDLSEASWTNVNQKGAIRRDFHPIF